MKSNIFLTKVLLSVILSTTGLGAHAFSVDDVTYNGLSADAAQYLTGNDSSTSINALGGSFIGDIWTFLDKNEAGSSTEIEGVTFNVGLGINSGEYTLSWDATGTPGLPLTMDFVFVDKAGPSYGAYLFEAEVFTSNPLSGTGTFDISWTNGGTKTPDLSHISIYGRAINISEVLEPGPLSLLGMGLLALGLTRRIQQTS